MSVRYIPDSTPRVGLPTRARLQLAVMGGPLVSRPCHRWATSGPPTTTNCDLATHIHRWPTGGVLSGMFIIFIYHPIIFFIYHPIIFLPSVDCELVKLYHYCSTWAWFPKNIMLVWHASMILFCQQQNI